MIALRKPSESEKYPKLKRKKGRMGVSVLSLTIDT
jgi:hypothetical protein